MSTYRLSTGTVDNLQELVGIKGYDSNETYSLNEVVLTVVSDSVLLYRSLENNNTSPLTDDTKWEKVELGGAIDIDGNTITLNSNDEIQTIGVIDNRSGSALKLWTGTRSQYNAIQSKDANTLYNITDDTGDLGTFANTDLSNLSNTGEAHFANPELSNLSTSGQAIIDGKSNVDLSNLSSTGENHFANPALTNSPYTTNRILEIPQDIKLELNNGKLTLKAGSKVYIPNGFEADGTTPKFDIVTIASDAVNSYAHNGFHENFWLYPNGKIYSYGDSSNFSGPTQPTGIGTYAVWYDTANNVIKNTGDGGSTWNGGISLPVCRALGGASDTVTSIDQIFNGFGYIGSTVFVLPGVKVQAPNGKNTDGTYKSNILTQLSVGLTNFQFDTSGALVVRPNSSTPLFDALWHFDSENGYISTSDNVPTNEGACILCGYVRVASSKIVDFTFGDVDSVVNSNASNFSQSGRSYLSGLGMPSDRYIDLTLGASGSSYTAPANGWFVVSGKPTANGGYCILDTNNYEPTYMTTNTNGWYDRGFIPVRKGQVMTLRYGNYEIEADRFKFIYAKGEQ